MARRDVEEDEELPEDHPPIQIDEEEAQDPAMRAILEMEVGQLADTYWAIAKPRSGKQQSHKKFG